LARAGSWLPTIAIAIAVYSAASSFDALLVTSRIADIT
jgi:hypothetical protein